MGRYIVLPIARDPAEAMEQSVEVVRENFPDWQERDADPMTLFLRSTAVLYAEVAELATGMGEEAFRYYGRGVANVPPVDERPATGRITVTAIDANGPYVVPEELEVIGRNALGEAVGFRTLASVVIPNGATTAEADVEAFEDGLGGNGISGAAEFGEYVDYLQSVAFVGATDEGRDAESDESFLDRLGDELEIASPRPILPRHFAVLARRLGAYRATAIDGLDPTVARNERQTVTVTGATGGSLTLTFNGETTGVIAFDATAAAVRTALEGLPSVFPGDIAATGGPLGTAAVTVEFTGGLGALNQPQMTATSSLTGAGAAVAVATAQEGVAATTTNRAMVAVAMVDEAGNPPPASEHSRISGELAAMREVGFAVPTIDPTYTTIDAAFTATAYPGFDPATVHAAAVQQLTDFLSPTRWGLREDTGEDREWLNEPLVRYLEAAERLQRVETLRFVDSLSIGIQGRTLGSANVVMPGYAPLPRPGNITGTVAAG